MRIALSALLVAAVFVGTPAVAADADRVARGEYLTRIGNCAGCHTAPGGAPFAGGLRLESEYGTFITPNITPDAATGIGDWDAHDFRAALHAGRRADGQPLYPACPYPDFTHIERADVDAIHAYLQRVPAVAQDNPGHNLRFPYGYRTLVRLWQTLYFEPGRLPAKPDRGPAWNRGRYLVEGLGHCHGCHRARDRFGARQDAADAPGAMSHGWYAPPLADPRQAGLQEWATDDAAAFLKSGRNAQAAMLGPMAGVVFDSLQYLRDDDARAMAVYLESIPEQQVASPQRLLRLSERGRKQAMDRGREIYADQCADCHGDNGQGQSQGGHGAPALAGNRAVTMAYPGNAANMIRQGGFAAATEGNPRPYGMPPFHDLSDRDLAAVLSFIRGSWGNNAAPVSATNLER